MKKIYLIATIFAILTGIAVYLFTNELRKESIAASQPQTVKVVTAAADIPQGAAITAEMLKTVSLPISAVSAAALRDENAALGKIAKYPIGSGEQLLDWKLMSIGDNKNAELAGRITQGYRAFTMSVDEISGLAGYLKVGNRVDIIITRSIDDVSSSFFCLQNVNIIAVGSSGTSGGYANITLEISARDSIMLNHNLLGGFARLVLRGPGDDEIITIPAYS